MLKKGQALCQEPGLRVTAFIHVVSPLIAEDCWPALKALRARWLPPPELDLT